MWAAPVIHSEPLQQDADFDAIDAYIEAEMAEWNLPGVALAIVQDGEIVYMKGYGNAGPDGRPMTAQTPLFIGSTSKSFTALAIMQLVEAGTIDLDEPAQTYLPWFQVADEAASAQITVRQLLNQDSGLSEASGRQWIGSKDQSDEAVNNAVRALADDELSHPVGQAYEYTNANYQVLGAIVQAVSGQSFEEYVQENIYDPLEMSNCYTSQDEALQNEMGEAMCAGGSAFTSPEHTPSTGAISLPGR
jgi:CubicO group peptidase (beta-lactamase class C family)